MMTGRACAWRLARHLDRVRYVPEFDGALTSYELSTLSLRSVMLSLLLAFVLSGFGCQSARTPGVQSAAENVRFFNEWLRQNVDIRTERTETNPESGLYEIDSWVEAKQLERGREAGYRIVLRVLFYQDVPENTVDTSAWSEITLEPGVPVRFSSTSLEPADGYMIELAYPEEVGIQ